MLPFWTSLRANRSARAALAGVNAAALGLLLAASYGPILTAAIRSGEDVALALVAFALLQLWKVPAWILALGAGLGAVIIDIA